MCPVFPPPGERGGKGYPGVPGCEGYDGEDGGHPGHAPGGGGGGGGFPGGGGGGGGGGVPLSTTWTVRMSVWEDHVYRRVYVPLCEVLTAPET